MSFKNIFSTTLLKIAPSYFLSSLRTALLVSSAVFMSLEASAERWDEVDLYVGAGIGQRDLTPHHVKNAGFTIDERWQAAWKLTAGLDINDHISIEGYYSNLGRAELSPDAYIGYRMAGADVMFHYWVDGEERMPGGIAVYAKAGLNETNTYHSKNVEEHDNIRKLLGGIGGEIYFPQEFSVRFEIESYNADATLLSLNLVKRFGFRSKKTSQKEFVAMIKQLPETAAGPKVAVFTPVVLDSDLDGSLDDEDKCPDTAQKTAVDEFGCAKVKTN